MRSMSTRARGLATGLAAAAVVACSFDYDQFQVPGGDGGASATTGIPNSGAGAGMGAGAGSGLEGGAGAGAAGAGAASPGGAGGSASGGGAGVGGTGGAGIVCGDGAIAGIEECDDANLTDGDGCTACVVDCPASAFKDATSHHCYEVIQGELTWQQALTACAALSPGTDLAALSTVAEFDAIVVQMDSVVWVGANDSTTENTFVWSNGEGWTYAPFVAPWELDQPNGTGDCVQMGYQEDALFDVSCLEMSDALCERTPLGT